MSQLTIKYALIKFRVKLHGERVILGFTFKIHIHLKLIMMFNSSLTQDGLSPANILRMINFLIRAV